MKSILATLVGATLLAAVPAQAATDLYLNITGVKGGESTTKGYEGFTPVLAWSWGLSYSGLPGSPGGINLQDLSWTQYLDSSFIQLYGMLTTSAPISTATLYAVKPGPTSFNYFQAIFNDNVLSSLSTGGSGGEDRFTANFSMATTSVTLRYRPTANASWVEASFTQPKPGAPAMFSGDPLAFQGLQQALVSSVPEPASWALMLGGLLLTGVALRRRQPA